MNQFFIEKDSDFYIRIRGWVEENINHEFYVIYGTQQNKYLEDFCRAVLSFDKTPVIITNVGNQNKSYSMMIRNCMALSAKVRVYESAKMAMNEVLLNRAELFVNTRGGIIWTP